MTVRTAQPTRDIEHLTRLLAEHLAKVQLLAPVGDLERDAGVLPAPHHLRRRRPALAARACRPRSRRRSSTSWS